MKKIYIQPTIAVEIINVNLMQGSVTFGNGETDTMHSKLSSAYFDYDDEQEDSEY